MPSRTALAALCAALVAVPAVADTPPPPPPQDLAGTYDSQAKTATLTWSPAEPGEWMYRVYRDGARVGKAWEPTFRDPQLPSGDAWVYLVTASPDGGFTWSDPALTPVSSLSCEVVTLSTSWDYPFLHVHLHEECVGGLVFDKDVTWTAEA